MRITYRRLEAGDRAVLDDVVPGTFDHPIIPVQAQAFLDEPNHELVVALDAGRVVGMVSAVVMLHPDKRPQLWVNELGVAEAWRRQGIATQLMQEIFDIADDRGCVEVWLGTEDSNVAARELYRSLGGDEDAVLGYTWVLEGGPRPAGAA